MEHHDPATVIDEAGMSDADHVDEAVLSELFELMGEGSSDALVQIFEAFQSGVPARLDDATAALAEGRLNEAARAGHNLRGTAGAFGARRLSQLSDDMEQACIRGDAESAVVHVAEMRSEFQAFHAILSSRLAALSTG